MFPSNKTLVDVPSHEIKLVVPSLEHWAKADDPFTDKIVSIMLKSKKFGITAEKLILIV